MQKTTEEETLFKRYKRFIENLYEESRLYRDLVYLSKFIRMFIYIVTGASIFIFVVLGKPMASFEDLIYLMTKTLYGRILALLIAFCFIIYGLERPRK
ncbi:MAG: hypothetical protein NTW30_03830 [Candidatus Aenigmarchaeota archaeon]|nr:hypothetical protein [Candidatus Aenigmarchaeota archaeon]